MNVIELNGSPETLNLVNMLIESDKDPLKQEVLAIVHKHELPSLFMPMMVDFLTTIENKCQMLGRVVSIGELTPDFSELLDKLITVTGRPENDRAMDAFATRVAQALSEYTALRHQQRKEGKSVLRGFVDAKNIQSLHNKTYRERCERIRKDPDPFHVEVVAMLDELRLPPLLGPHFTAIYEYQTIKCIAPEEAMKHQMEKVVKLHAEALNIKSNGFLEDFKSRVAQAYTRFVEIAEKHHTAGTDEDPDQEYVYGNKPAISMS